ncbi:21747_t:CDS:2 [Rhizophagus irregularis]|nr:21747_t:CDS:2 [Rhizophagus irregularis]
MSSKNDHEQRTPYVQKINLSNLRTKRKPQKLYPDCKETNDCNKIEEVIDDNFHENPIKQNKSRPVRFDLTCQIDGSQTDGLMGSIGKSMGPILMTPSVRLGGQVNRFGLTLTPSRTVNNTNRASYWPKKVSVFRYIIEKMLFFTYRSEYDGK